LDALAVLAWVFAVGHGIREWRLKTQIRSQALQITQVISIKRDRSNRFRTMFEKWGEFLENAIRKPVRKPTANRTPFENSPTGDPDLRKLIT
jgi:hypothetical protein